MAQSQSPVDVAALDQRVEHINRMMNTHAGAIEVVDVTEDGVLNLRFVGMCQGCPFRPVTFFGVVSQMLAGVPGVTDVRAEGVRVSQEAASRASELIGSDFIPRLS